MPRKTEAEIADAMVAILRDRSSGRATIADLIDEIPNRLNSLAGRFGAIAHSAE